MQARKLWGFSLIELMVVVAIICIISIISAPIYKSYLVKSRFAEVFTSMTEYKDELHTAFLEQDQFPDQFDDIPVSTYTPITSEVLKLIYYGRSTDKQAAYLHFYTLDLGVSGYTAVSDSGSGGANCRLTLAAVATDVGDMRFYCGQWDGSSVGVPLENLPLNCRDTNISALIS